jgi:tRNA-specific 2-thiouridylase
MSKKVYVGMSGGVDSSVSAALLVEQGYDVTGVYMKNWSKDLPGFPCPWKDDYQDAKRVAVKLGIPFIMVDFEQEYFDRVVQYMLEGFKAGITPNPDIMCNQEIKFKLFHEVALSQGADYIATGHYANTQRGRLLKAKDQNKDQTYFLYRVKSDGNMTKPEVREAAQRRGLITAQKKESMGICFVGKVGIKEFLSTYLKNDQQARSMMKPGEIIDQNGSVIGEHEGSLFYTIGQRHGLDVGGGLPYYVTHKNVSANQVFVTNNLEDKSLWSDTITLSSTHWITDEPDFDFETSYQIRTRHRAQLLNCRVTKEQGNVVVQLSEPLRALTPGQSAVLYRDNECIGGGIIS